MTKKPKIILVGADKGGVGKTTVTRILSDYLSSKGIGSKYFDTEWPAGDLKRFIPTAEIVDLTRVESQMKVFDTFEQNMITVIDLRSGMMSPTLEELDNARLLDDVRAGRMNLVLLHVLGPTITSLQEIVVAANRIGGGAQHWLVKNYINDTTFFDWDKDQDNSPLRTMKDLTITIPHLTERAAEEIQKSAADFVTFSNDRNQSRILTGRVHRWIKDTFTEFDKARLSELEDA